MALLTPVAKAFATDIGCEVASIGVQVHGGMGFIEETGAAQHYRDARILPIYEGTNGIQAIDLVARKLPLEGGKVVYGLHRRSRVPRSRRCAPRTGRSSGAWGQRLGEAVAAFAEATRWIGGALKRDSDSAMAAAAPYLRLFGLAAGGVYLAKGALASARNGAGGGQGDGQEDGQGDGKADVRAHPIAIARFFAETLATAAPGLKDAVLDGAAATLLLAPDAL